MKNRLIITLKDSSGIKSYNVHKMVKKLIIFTILAAVVILGISFWFIGDLNKRIDEKESDIQLKEEEVFKLTKEAKKLRSQNQFYSMQIQGKVEDLKGLSSKLDDIKERVGFEKGEKKEIITKETLALINDKIKMHMLKTIPNGLPLDSSKVTSKYGYRYHPILKKRKFHRGIDFKAKRKTPIYSTADGVVSFVQSRNIGSFGRVIKIQHNYGFETVYAHLNKTNVKVGDVVKKNQLIGLSGNSGRSTAPHLHYEVKYGSKILDPKNFIKWQFEDYYGILDKEKRVQWESLVKLISEQQKMIAQ